MRTFFTEVILGLLAAIFVLLLIFSIWLALPVTLLLVALFVWNGIKVVPATPPHKAILVFLGRRQKVRLNEGWNWLPLRPLIFSLVPIKVEKVVDEIPKQEVRTPDRALVTMTSSIVWTPGIADDPDSLIMYLNSGGESGVKKITHNVIEDRIKTWASSDREGPSNWEEAQALRDDAHAVLAKALLGSALPDIAVGGVKSPIPTSTWMRFFDRPQSEPTDYDCTERPGPTGPTRWASVPETGVWNWDGLQAIFDGYSSDEQDALKDRIDRRRKDIKDLREGKANFGHPSLGITIHQFTVNELMVGGAVAVAADQAEKERNEMEADNVEIKNVSDRIAELRRRHPKMPLEEAVRLVQTERGKVSKSVIEVLGASTGLGQDVLAALGVQRMSGGGQQTPPGNLPSAGNPGNQGGGIKDPDVI